MLRNYDPHLCTWIWLYGPKQYSIMSRVHLCRIKGVCYFLYPRGPTMCCPSKAFTEGPAAGPGVVFVMWKVGPLQRKMNQYQNCTRDWMWLGRENVTIMVRWWIFFFNNEIQILFVLFYLKISMYFMPNIFQESTHKWGGK